MARQKTIFISSFFGLIARNILATDVLKILRNQPDLRIVILAPQAKQALYHREFAATNVIVEGVPDQPASRLDRILSAVFLNASDTAARRIHRLREFKRDRRYLNFIARYFLAKAANFQPVRRLLRLMDYWLMPKNKFQSYFEKHRPDLVFATDIFEPHDVNLIRETVSRKIPVIGMVRSWDNITTKGLNRIIPDKTIVNTEKIKEEAVRYNDINPADISVVGIPHYDSYVSEPRTSREELFKKLQLDPRRKTIFFAPPSDIYSQNDTIAEKAVNILQSFDVQLLLRLYLVGNVRLGSIRPIPNKIAIDEPASGADFRQADLTSGDSHLADLLYHSDVVIAFASSLAIDAVVFNKPVVFIGFDGELGRPYWQSLRRFYDYDHQQSILKTGGVRLAKTPEEMIRFVEDYLANPKLDEAGRKKIIEERCWKLDGRSGERLAQAILKEFTNHYLAR
jgi:hypothetical protein